MRAICVVMTFLLLSSAMGEEVNVKFNHAPPSDSIDELICSDLTARTKGIAVAIYFAGWQIPDYEETLQDPNSSFSSRLIANWQLASIVTNARLISEDLQSARIEQNLIEKFFRLIESEHVRVPIEWRQWVSGSKLQRNGYLNTLQGTNFPDFTSAVESVLPTTEGIRLITASKSFILPPSDNLRNPEVVGSIESEDAIYVLLRTERGFVFCAKVVNSGQVWISPLNTEWSEPRGSDLFVQLVLSEDESQLFAFSATSVSFSINRLNTSDGKLTAGFCNLLPRLNDVFTLSVSNSQ